MSQETQTMQVQDYHVTFGVQYRHEPHPVLSFPNLPDGYVTIEAPDMETARAVATALFGERYAFLYEGATHDTGWYPAGELARYGWDKDELAGAVMDRVRTHGAPIPLGMLPIAGIITEEANLHTGTDDKGPALDGDLIGELVEVDEAGEVRPVFPQDQQ